MCALGPTRAIIDLSAIGANLRGVRDAVGSEVMVLAAVKANAYGHGAVEVSRMIEREGIADFLGVATVPEALELRAAGIGLPILKLSPCFDDELADAVRHRVTLCLGSPENAAAAQRVCAELEGTATVHLKVDTGMGRVGVAPSQAAQVAAYIEQQCPALTLEGIFTHLPVSDSEAGEEYTEQQIDRFCATVDEVEAFIDRPIPIVHASNSGAVLGHRRARLDMVRPGIMIYGYYPDMTTPHTISVRPAMSVVTRLSQVKKVEAGTPIGYGSTWTALEDTVIGTFPAGYADGFNRLFSNRGRVLVRGRSYPVVGRVCMDQSMVDLGPEATAQPGDEVVLLGRSGSEVWDADDWAALLSTISYEVTCQISPRVSRIYR